MCVFVSPTLQHWTKCRASVEWKWQGKTEVLREKAVSLTLSTTNPTWTGLESNLGLHDKRTVTNHVSHDMGKITYENCSGFLSAGSHKRQMKLIFRKWTLMEKVVVLNYCNFQEFSIRIGEKIIFALVSLIWIGCNSFGFFKYVGNGKWLDQCDE
jgi:hypothetical protein